LARYDIYSIVSQPKKITLLQSGVGNPLLQNLYAFKNLLLGKINALFNEPSASFSAGLLLGARRQIPANILEDFKTVGLTHILAISGYNIALVIIFCSTLFNFVSRKQKFWLVATGVIGFVFLVGPSASVVRAAIMGLLAFLALNLGRQAVVTANLFLAADLMILANPLILVADAGFQLSFLSVAGLIFLSPLLSEWFNKMPEKFGLREGLLLTLSASLATAPWIAYAFGRFSLIAPLANVLVAPAIPLAMAGIFCALVVGFIFPPLGALLAFLTNGFLSYILKVAEVLAKLPLASWETKMVDEKFLVIYYAVLVVLILRKNRREQLEA
jgi:competence protein ComEC